jgi:hypothetical protein
MSSQNRLCGDALRLPPPLEISDSDSIDVFAIKSNRPSARRLVRQIREAFAGLVAACNGDVVEASNIAADAMNEAADTCRTASEIDGTPGTVAAPGADDDADADDSDDSDDANSILGDHDDGDDFS